MVEDYGKVLKTLCDEFFEDGSADIDSIQTNRDYKEALRMLGCEVEEDYKDDIELLLISMKVNNIKIPSYDIKFAAHPYLLTHRDNPLRVETAISYAIEQYGKEIHSDKPYIDQDIAVVGINFETEDDANRFYGLITEKYSKINKIWDFIYKNL
ncbi:MAG: hypothetical protein KAS11_00680 [Candidatus Aenigmarchaeota archaeon]|nr:hypothetical protein [Candidatus Aenigmarchaeota archaeon]